MGTEGRTLGEVRSVTFQADDQIEHRLITQTWTQLQEPKSEELCMAAAFAALPYSSG